MLKALGLDDAFALAALVWIHAAQISNKKPTNRRNRVVYWLNRH
jgi:hypothetical protein